MENSSFYNEVLTEHKLRPAHKHDLPDANLVLEGVNASCGDDILLKLKVEDGIIREGSFVGDGCAVSQASADMMLDLVIGKKKEEAVELAENFFSMIRGTAKAVSYTHLDVYKRQVPGCKGVPEGPGRRIAHHYPQHPDLRIPAGG